MAPTRVIFKTSRYIEISSMLSKLYWILLLLQIVAVSNYDAAMPASAGGAIIIFNILLLVLFKIIAAITRLFFGTHIPEATPMAEIKRHQQALELQALRNFLSRDRQFDTLKPLTGQKNELLDRQLWLMEQELVEGILAKASFYQRIAEESLNHGIQAEYLQKLQQKVNDFAPLRAHRLLLRKPYQKEEPPKQQKQTQKPQPAKAPATDPNLARLLELYRKSDATAATPATMKKKVLRIFAAEVLNIPDNARKGNPRIEELAEMAFQKL